MIIAGKTVLYIRLTRHWVVVPYRFNVSCSWNS